MTSSRYPARRFVATLLGIGACISASAVSTTLRAEGGSLADAPSRAEDPNYDPDAAKPVPAPSSRGSSDANVRYGAAREAPPPPPPDNTPELEGDDVRARVRDIVLNPWPPPWKITLALGGIYPFQIAGGGLGIEAYVGDSVRLSAFYSVGITQGAMPDETPVTSYAEVLVGVRFAAVPSSIGVTIVGEDTREFWQHDKPAPVPLFKTHIPATHAFLAEIGMLTGAIPRMTCVQHCEAGSPTDPVYQGVNPQLFYPEAGIRYVFFSQASSEREGAAVNTRWQVDAFVHALYKPFNDTSEHVVWGDESHVTKGVLGGAVGVRFPICRRPWCLKISVTGGYLPSPGTPLVALGTGW